MSRSVTSAEPSGRNAMPHGTVRPLASTFVATCVWPSSSRTARGRRARIRRQLRRRAQLVGGRRAERAAREGQHRRGGRRQGLCVRPGATPAKTSVARHHLPFNLCRGGGVCPGDGHSDSCRSHMAAGEFQDFVEVRYGDLLRTAYLLTGAARRRGPAAGQPAAGHAALGPGGRAVRVRAAGHGQPADQHLAARCATPRCSTGDLPDRGADPTDQILERQRCCRPWTGCRCGCGRCWSCATGRTCRRRRPRRCSAARSDR